MKQSTTSIIMTLALIAILPFQLSFAESAYDEKLSFAGSLEETLGHFWAIEQNLDDNNAELALVHATHPIAELYSSMKPELKEASPEFDAKIEKTLIDLGKRTGSDVTRQDAQTAIDEAKAIIQEARILIVGQETSQDTAFRAQLMQGLLNTSIEEYKEGVQNSQIEMMAEFQDGSAFVWKSEEIFNKIRADLPEHEAEEIEEFYEELWNAYEQKVDSSNSGVFVDGIIHEVNEILGEEGKEGELLEYVENIEELLTQVKTEYENGNSDLALSLSTKAYLDNFEYLETPLKEAGQEELVEELETMMREELREMIKNGASSSEVNSKVDTILEEMKIVEATVPEFGTIVMAVLFVAIIGIILVTKKTRLTDIPRM